MMIHIILLNHRSWLKVIILLAEHIVIKIKNMTFYGKFEIHHTHSESIVLQNIKNSILFMKCGSLNNYHIIMINKYFVLQCSYSFKI